jgi:hypothetical protein
MKLPAKCPHRRSSKNWRPWFANEDVEDRPPCCRQTDSDPFTVWFQKSRPLCEKIETTIEEYRFTWRSSFDGHAVVQIGRGETPRGETVVIMDWARGGLGETGRYWRGMNSDSWDRLEAAIFAAGFWCLDQFDHRIGLDGARWMIEGRRRDVYGVIERWSPDGSVHDLGRTFFELAGPPISDIRLY